MEQPENSPSPIHQPVLPLAEIESRYDSEWVLLDQIESGPGLQVEAGRVLWHSVDREEVYRKAASLHPPRHFAVVYTGDFPGNVEFLL